MQKKFYIDFLANCNETTDRFLKAILLLIYLLADKVNYKDLVLILRSACPAKRLVSVTT